MNNSENPDKKILKKGHKHPSNWKWGIFYYNPEDPRAIVPKKAKWMGYTINFANRSAVLLFFIILLFFAFVVYAINS